MPTKRKTKTKTKTKSKKPKLQRVGLYLNRAQYAKLRKRLRKNDMTVTQWFKNEVCRYLAGLA